MDEKMMVATAAACLIAAGWATVLIWYIRSVLRDLSDRD